MCPQDFCYFSISQSENSTILHMGTDNVNIPFINKKAKFSNLKPQSQCTGPGSMFI